MKVNIKEGYSFIPLCDILIFDLPIYLLHLKECYLRTVTI